MSPFSWRRCCRVPEEHQPLLIAIAERFAAERYRGWAAGTRSRGACGGAACLRRARRKIAGRMEGLYPNAAAIQARLRVQNPDLFEINRALFDRPVRQRWSIQAQGERLGAATWRSLARREADPTVRRCSTCAQLEEASAVVPRKASLRKD